MSHNELWGMGGFWTLPIKKPNLLCFELALPYPEVNLTNTFPGLTEGVPNFGLRVGALGMEISALAFLTVALGSIYGTLFLTVVAFVILFGIMS
jgi:hypothetical protein